MRLGYRKAGVQGSSSYPLPPGQLQISDMEIILVTNQWPFKEVVAKRVDSESHGAGWEVREIGGKWGGPYDLVFEEGS